eukprot:8565240-Pyramimonas_sp.AAC.1
MAEDLDQGVPEEKVAVGGTTGVGRGERRAPLGQGHGGREQDGQGNVCTVPALRQEEGHQT